MKMMHVEDLTPADLADHPVWEYLGDGETLVRPVLDLPVASLQNRVVGTTLWLANRTPIIATLSNISLTDFRCNMHFLTVSVEKVVLGVSPVPRYFEC